MHDAPPPPLDRQGIGRFPAGCASPPTSHSTTPRAGGYAGSREFFDGRTCAVLHTAHPATARRSGRVA